MSTLVADQCQALYLSAGYKQLGASPLRASPRSTGGVAGLGWGGGGGRGGVGSPIQLHGSIKARAVTF